MAEAAEMLASRLNKTFEAIAKAFTIAAMTCAADALVYLADYMNGCDAVEDCDVEAFEIWVERGKP